MQAIARIAEQRISQAIKEGALDNLEGAGKPLDLNDDAWVPEDLRLAFRVLRNAGIIPPELELRNEIMNLRALMETIDNDKERLKRLRELNYKLMCLNERRENPLRLEDFPAYEQEMVARLTGG